MSVYDEIRAERSAQDAKWGGHGHDDHHVPTDWLRFIAEHLAKALGCKVEIIDEVHWFTAHISGSVDGMPAYRQQLVRVAALAVAAIESHDRRAAQRG